MSSIKLLDKEVDNKKILVAIFLFGVFLRAIRLFYEPVGINQDEAYAGYEAWALLNYGIDSNGYSWPIYFTSWGSGMNVLYSYLSIPFIAIFGLNEFSVKIVQVLFVCLSIPLFYKVISNFCSDTMSLLGTLIFAINPWHITMAQWGLESNLAPFFLLALTYYLMKYFEAQRVKYIILAGLFGGLSLYTYAPLWLFVPTYIILLFAYALWTRQIKIRKEYFLFAAILFVFALPLILFLMVQYDIIPEGKILCFSIPKMYYFRSGEVGAFNKENFENFLMMLLKQNGYPGENATKTVGDYYLIFTPFIVIGFLRCIKRLVLSIKKREFNFESSIGLWFLISFILASNISYINTNKANYIHIPIIIFSITGIETILNKLPWLSKITAFATILAFFAFIVPFFDSDTQLHYSLTNDYSQVLDYTEKYIKENDAKVYLDNAINPIQYSHLFYYTKPAPTEVVEHLEKTWYGLGENYKNYHFAHNDIISFEDGAIYVYPKEWEGYITYNFSVEKIFETSSEYVIFKKIS